MIFSAPATQGRAATGALGRRLLALAPALWAAAAGAQEAESFLMRSSPAPMFSQPPKKDYNLHWGPLTARLHGTMQAEFNDNINLVERNPASDVYFFPNFGIGMQWPISPKNILELNLGVGYRVYVDHAELNTFSISPDTRLMYQMRIGKVNVLLRDSFTLQVDPLTRPDISGSASGALLNFKRINNDIGAQGEWQARSDLTLVSSYDYIVDRSLNEQFAALDRDDHNLALGAYTKIGSAWTVGVNTGLTLTDYIEPVQNDGVSFSVGPQVSVKVTRFITVDGNVSYTQSKYDQTGSIADRSEFSGMSFAFAVKHNINSRMNHSLRWSRSISPGFGSNFNELTSLQYSASWRFSSLLALNSTVTYENLEASGVSGERADRYLWYLGTGWQVARRWHVGLGYSMAWKNSDQAQRDYRQNRVTVDLTHDF